MPRDVVVRSSGGAIRSELVESMPEMTAGPAETFFAARSLPLRDRVVRGFGPEAPFMGLWRRKRTASGTPARKKMMTAATAQTTATAKQAMAM